MHTDLPLNPASSSGSRQPALLNLTLAFLAAMVAGASLVGCAGVPSRNRDVLKRTQPPQPILTDSAVYGAGALTVECWLGPTVRLKKAENKAATGTQPDRSAPFVQGASDYTAQEIDEMYGRTNYEAVLPPRSALTLRIFNSGNGPVTLAIADVNSTLGDFATRPEILKLAPGQQGSVDPMLTSRDENFDELDVTVALKIGGKTEAHLLHLHPLLPPVRPE